MYLHKKFFLFQPSNKKKHKNTNTTRNQKKKIPNLVQIIYECTEEKSIW